MPRGGREPRGGPRGGRGGQSVHCPPPDPCGWGRRAHPQTRQPTSNWDSRMAEPPSGVGRCESPSLEVWGRSAGCVPLLGTVGKVASEAPGAGPAPVPSSRCPSRVGGVPGRSGRAWLGSWGLALGLSPWGPFSSSSSLPSQPALSIASPILFLLQKEHCRCWPQLPPQTPLAAVVRAGCQLERLAYLTPSDL